MLVPVRLAFFYFAFFAQAGAFVSYFSLFLAARGFSAAEIAAAVAMPQIARIVAPVFWGWLADWLDGTGAVVAARRAIVVFAAFSYLGCYLALYLAQGPAAVALVLLVSGLLIAGAGPLAEAITLSALGGRAERYGPIRLWGSVGFIATVLGIGVWLDTHDVAGLLDMLVALSALTCVAALLLPGGAPERVQQAAARLGEVLARGEVRAFFAACFCMTAAHGAMYVFYTIYLETAGYSRTTIGVLWTLGVLAEIVLFLRLPQLLRRFTLRALLLASFGCAAIRFLAIGWGVESLAVLAAAQLLHAATFGAFHASSVAAVHRLFPGPLEARGQALFSMVTYGMGSAAGSLVAGWTWGALGPSASFAVSAFFGVLGGVLVWWRVRV
jgi:PPP family 3-phenylpropionic acid transporter